MEFHKLLIHWLFLILFKSFSFDVLKGERNRVGENIPDDGAVMFSLLLLVLASTASSTNVWGSPPSCPGTHRTSRASLALAAPRRVQFLSGDGLAVKI